MRKWARSILMLLMCIFLLSACQGRIDPSPQSNSSDEYSFFEKEITIESVPRSLQEPETTQETTSQTMDREVNYLPFIANDYYDEIAKVENGFRGYRECLGDYFTDDGQWNAYIVYAWGQEDFSKTIHHNGRDMASWMKELGLTVIEDYPYCAYYVETNGAPKGYTVDQLSVYADCVVAGPESKMKELFGEGSAAVHGLWLRILPAMDPSLPYPEWYDPNKTYYYRGKRVFD